MLTFRQASHPELPSTARSKVLRTSTDAQRAKRHCREGERTPASTVARKGPMIGLPQGLTYKRCGVSAQNMHVQYEPRSRGADRRCSVSGRTGAGHSCHPEMCRGPRLSTRSTSLAVDSILEPSFGFVLDLSLRMGPCAYPSQTPPSPALLGN